MTHSGNKTILVCPLNWGLGHAARVSAIISELDGSGYRVVIGADRTALAFLKLEFPGLETIRIKDIRPRYSRLVPAWVMIAASIPALLYSIFREHHLLARILRERHPDLVISDNRYGLWNRKVPCVILTHQLSPVLPAALRMFEGLLGKILRTLVGKFDSCWIPDTGSPGNLSGRLSADPSGSLHVRHVGLLSRFSRAEKIDPEGPPEYRMVIIASGPDPQRSEFIRILLSQEKELTMPAILVAGNPGGKHIPESGPNCTVVPHLDSPAFNKVLCRAEFVICRAGYSTIMDMVVLGKKALLVPTPGQPEQEYLAKRMADSGMFPFLSQGELSLKSAIELLEAFPFSQGFQAEKASVTGLIEEQGTAHR